MKLKHLTALILFFSVTNAFCQNQITLSTSETIVGKSLVDNSDIIGKEYTFPDHIYKTYFDTASNYLTVQLRGIKGKYYNNKGKIVQVNTSDNSIIWSKEINYQNTQIQHHNKIIVQVKANQSQLLDIYSGNPTFELKNHIYFVDSDFNVGIGYKSSSANDFSNKLEGVNILNGSILWQREINREFGWNNFFYINDSTVIIVSAGIHSLNVKTGQGWDYDAETGHNDYKGTVAKNVAGAALGVLTGFAVVSTGHKVIHGMASNVLMDSNYFYFASKEEIAKINKATGEVLWKSNFESFAGQSILYMDSSNIYMINKGLAKENNSQQISYKKPFLAAFSRQTGQQIYLIPFEEKDNPILGQIVKNDYEYLLFKNKIVKYNTKTRNNQQKQYDTKQFGDLSFFIGNHVFVKNDEGSITNLVASDTTKFFVYSESGTVLSIDENLNICNTISNDKLTVSSVNGSELSFFGNQDKTLIMNGRGDKCAELYAILNPKNSYIIKNTLYYINDKKLCIINLDNLDK